MRPFLPSFKTLFVGFGLALAAVAAQAQTVSIAGGLSVHAEGNSGSTTRTITLTKTGAAATVLNFSYPGTATYAATFPPNTPGDYTFSGPGIVITGPSTGTMALPTGNVVRTITVTVRGDLVYEASDVEEAYFFFTTATNGYTFLGDILSTTQITGSQDIKPTVSWSYSAQSEAVGTALLSVSLSARSDQPVTVDAATSHLGCTPSGCTATAAPSATADYAPATASLTIPAYSVSTTFAVPVFEDSLNEGNEIFRAVLSNPVNADPGLMAGNVIISDNDPLPTVSIGADQSFLEGASGSTPRNFPVTLSAPSGRLVLVQASAGGGTALGGNNDYLGSTVNLSFAPGETVKNYSVAINGDTTPELDETFFVNITAISNVTNGSDLQAQATIQNDDSPALTINDPIPANEDTGTVTFRVAIQNPAPPGGVGFTYQASSGPGCPSTCTATPGAGPVLLAGEDYVAAAPPITVNGGPGGGGIEAGQTFVDITIAVNPDSDPEANETFKVTLSAPTGTFATILDGTGVATILNDDQVPAGSLVISEFRLSGPNGIQDEFIEVANTTSSPITVFTTALDGTSGYGVVNNDGALGTLIFVIPNGTVIPAGGHYLATGAQYSLSGLAAGNAAIPTNLPDSSGLAIFASETDFTAPNRIDSVGFASFDSGSLFVEPAGCPPGPTCGLPNGGVPFGGQYSFVRKYVYGSGGTLQDEVVLPGPVTSGSKEDFVLVADNALSYGGTLSVLGGPQPQNLASEIERSAEYTIASPDGGYKVFPSIGGSPKALEIYRTFQHPSAMSAVRFKVVNLTGVNSGVVGAVDLRPTKSDPATGPGPAGLLYSGLSLEGDPAPIGYPVTTPATTPSFVPNGGLNSTLRYAGGTAANEIIKVNFRSEYSTTGTFYYWVIVEAK